MDVKTTLTMRVTIDIDNSWEDGATVDQIFLCSGHARDTNEAYRKAESKGCGRHPEIELHEQEPEVAIALKALGEL